MCVISAAILLVYCILLLPPLCFCINCSLERVDLTSHTPPPHSSHLPSTDFSADRQCLGGGGGRFGFRGMGCPAPTPQAGRVTVSHGGGRVRVGELDLSHPPPPHSSNLSSTDFSADRQCLGGGGGLGSGGCAAPPPCHKGEGGGDEGWWEGGTMAPCYMELERLNFYIDYEAFKQRH
jgi:hypothetical protein